MIYRNLTQEEVDALDIQEKCIAFTGNGFDVYTGEDMPVNPIPDVISKRQLCIQLVRDGIYQNVIDYIASLPANNEIKIGFETATEFHRTREDVQQMFAFFQVDINEFFISAAQIV